MLAISHCPCGNQSVPPHEADHYPIDYPEPEAIILLGKNGFTIKEVFVTMQKRSGGKSSITFLLSIYYMIKVMIAILFNFVRKRIVED